MKLNTTYNNVRIKQQAQLQHSTTVYLILGTKRRHTSDLTTWRSIGAIEHGGSSRVHRVAQQNPHEESLGSDKLTKMPKANHHQPPGGSDSADLKLLTRRTIYSVV